jgi:hypothetical protein
VFVEVELHPMIHMFFSFSSPNSLLSRSRACARELVIHPIGTFLPKRLLHSSVPRHAKDAAFPNASMKIRNIKPNIHGICLIIIAFQKHPFRPAT